MSTLAERLSTLMEQTHTSVSTLQKVVDVTYEMARRYKLGTATPRDEKIEKMAVYFNVTPAYLKYGEESIDTPRALNLLPLGATPDDEECEDAVVLEVLNIEASAGFGAVNGDVIQVIKELRFVPEAFKRYYPGVNDEITRVINVKGDSMQPTLYSGDLLFVDISVNYFDGDGIYIFTFDDTLFVKRLQKTGRKLCVISDNKANYNDWDITADEAESLIIHGKVRVHQSQKLNYVG